MKKRKILLNLLAFLICAGILFPFFWAIVTSLKSGSDLFSANWIPRNPSLDHYRAIFITQPFILNLFNSLLIATLTVVISTSLGTLAAYSLARHRFRGRRTILYTFLCASMFPQIALLSGLFEFLRGVGLFNHRFGLVSSYLIFALPFTVWTLTAFMREIPRSLEEAALLDGASHFLMISRILLPILTPSLVSTCLLTFIAAWNEFLFALTFSVTDQSRTVPVAIAFMSGASEHEIPWGMIMAASVIVTLPIIGLVLFFQKRIVSGLTAGSVKG